jgi:DNA-binding GntR family transcriptional regulator
MREAVRRLESERMLTVYPRRGTISADVNIRDLKSISDARRVAGRVSARTCQLQGGRPGPWW